MSSTRSHQPPSSKPMPGLRAESGYEEPLEPRPIRFSGVLSAVFGLLSPLCLLGPALLVLPLISLALGAFALRPWRGVRPIGMNAARVGLVLAVGFGACGLFLAQFRARTLSAQAEYFGREFLELVAAGHDEYALELLKPASDRSLPTTPLKELYQREELAAQALADFRQEPATQEIQQTGPEAEWELLGSPRVFTQQGVDRVELIFIDLQGGVSSPVRLVLDYLPNPETSRGEWSVGVFELTRAPPLTVADF